MGTFSTCCRLASIGKTFWVSCLMVSVGRLPAGILRWADHESRTGAWVHWSGSGAWIYGYGLGPRLMYLDLALGLWGAGSLRPWEHDWSMMLQGLAWLGMRSLSHGSPLTACTWCWSPWWLSVYSSHLSPGGQWLCPHWVVHDRGVVMGKMSNCFSYLLQCIFSYFCVPVILSYCEDSFCAWRIIQSDVCGRGEELGNSIPPPCWHYTGMGPVLFHLNPHMFTPASSHWVTLKQMSDIIYFISKYLGMCQ